VRFWDSSAVVPLLHREPASEAVRALYDRDATMIVAWTTIVECGSRIARLERDAAIEAAQAANAFARLDEIARGWLEVEPAGEVREIARRLLRAHQLRAGDALQIASATLAAERRPATLEFVTLDDRLETAALKEGFPVVVPGR
jgi:uncharacterized protein